MDWKDFSDQERSQIIQQINWSEITLSLTGGQINPSPDPVSVLTDDSLIEWPEHDTIVTKIRCNKWSLMNWLFQIRNEKINLHSKNVVLYVPKMQSFYRDAHQLNRALHHLLHSLKIRKAQLKLIIVAILPIEIRGVAAQELQVFNRTVRTFPNLWQNKDTESNFQIYLFTSHQTTSGRN